MIMENHKEGTSVMEKSHKSKERDAQSVDDAKSPTNSFGFSIWKQSDHIGRISWQHLFSVGKWEEDKLPE